MLEEFKIELNDEIIHVRLKKKIFNKHVYLRVKGKNLLEISSHRFFSKNAAIDLIRKQKVWIKNKIKYYDKEKENENVYFFLGLKYEKNDLTQIQIDEIYKKKIKTLIPILVNKYSKIMNLYPTSIKYRKNKKTWGSCNYKNGLNFNILLAQFPLEIIEYVVIHELAHIKHKNHSKQFWSLVEKYCKDYKKIEKKFKTFL